MMEQSCFQDLILKVDFRVSIPTTGLIHSGMEYISPISESLRSQGMKSVKIHAYWDFHQRPYNSWELLSPIMQGASVKLHLNMPTVPSQVEEET